VHWLPVTTDPSVALGRECWGYPKERADITVTDGPDGIRAVVDGGRYGERETVRLEVARPRRSPRARDWTMASFTRKDGDLLRTTARIEGEVAIGIGPSVGTRLEVTGRWRGNSDCGGGRSPDSTVRPFERVCSRGTGPRVTRSTGSRPEPVGPASGYRLRSSSRSGPNEHA